MEKLDVSLSVGGKNRFALWCKEHDQRRFYGSCLCLVDSYKSGRLDGNNPVNTCAVAMQHGRCPAMGMREEELTKGEAIYYTPPVQISAYEGSNVDKTSESYIRGWNQVGTSVGRTDENVATVKKKEMTKVSTVSLKQSTMAEVISAELKKEQVRNAKIAELKKMKDEIAELVKTNPSQARSLLAKAQELKASIVSGGA
jgi:hypothetical protein